MQQYFNSVEERRKETQKIAKQSNYRDEKDGIDPLNKWKQNFDKGLVKKIGYEAAPPKSESLFGNLVIPVNPIGIERFDEGERFDLRLPYAETGYEDPDADVLGKLGKGISNLFGFGKQKNEDKDKKNETQPSKKK